MLTLDDAKKVIAAAERKAKEAEQMNIAVADAGGNLVAHVRMDEAWMGASRRHSPRVRHLTWRTCPNPVANSSDPDGRVMIFAGGVPLKRAGKVVGAIGVSSGSRSGRSRRRSFRLNFMASNRGVAYVGPESRFGVSTFQMRCDHGVILKVDLRSTHGEGPNHRAHRVSPGPRDHGRGDRSRAGRGVHQGGRPCFCSVQRPPEFV